MVFKDLNKLTRVGHMAIYMYADVHIHQNKTLVHLKAMLTKFVQKLTYNHQIIRHLRSGQTLSSLPHTPIMTTLVVIILHNHTPK